MLTLFPVRSGSSSGAAPARGGQGPPKRPIRSGLRAFALLAVSAHLVTPSLVRPSKEKPSHGHHWRATQLEAGGARWLESTNQELVHFVCEPGAPYVVSLNSASMIAAGLAPETFPAFLEALRAAVADWRGVLRCDRIRTEMDSLDADTRVFFAYVDTPGTLAVATRAEDIVLNAGRAWFPGSQRQGNYSETGTAVSFYWVIAHELGHVWGLAHSESPSSLMYPTQCDSCRWSSFEQAAGNLVHAAGLVPDWSRPYYANRFFVKTPVAVIPRLLTGELPDEPLWSAVAEQCEGDRCMSSLEGKSTPGEGMVGEPTPCSALVGLAALRPLRPSDLARLGVSRVMAKASFPRNEPLPPPESPNDPEAHKRAPWALVPRMRAPWEPGYGSVTGAAPTTVF